MARSVEHILGLPSSEWDDGLFNLGGDLSLPIIEVAQMVAAEYFSYYGEDIEVIPGDSDDSNNSAPVRFSIEKLKATGFKPTYNTSHEIRRTFEISKEIAGNIN